MSAAAERWEPVVGLEVHVQLATRTKLFCACPNTFGAPPNTAICPVCTGQPGVLPMPNAGAVRLALRLGLALDAEVDARSVFARKHYFYCDLPKGYQISQYERPLCRGGRVPLPSGRAIPLVRAHLEEDAGKAVHDRGPGTLVDLNRAGVPLLEIVSEPALRGAAEAASYLETLRELARWTGASDGDMEKGSLRCDVNVSVRRKGTEALGTKVELKNLNSFRHVAESIEHEVARQVALLEAGGAVRQETRLWDPERAETRVLRSKEDAADYRYLDDPDLPPLSLPAEWISAERAALPELPAARRGRYVEEFGLSEYDAGVLTASRVRAEFFEEALAVAGDAKLTANWVANEVLAALAPDEGPEALGFGARALGELLALVRAGGLSNNAAKKVFQAMRTDPRPPAELARELGLVQVDDEEAIEAWCRAVLAESAEIAEQVRGGNAKALGALIGPVMQRSGGRANPQRVRAALARLLALG